MIVTLVVRSPALPNSTADSDEALFWLVTRALLAGHLPYFHIWECKAPLVFFILAAFAKLFGMSVIGFRLAATTVVIATALGLYRIGLLFPDKPGVVGLAAALSYAALTASDAGLASEPELFLAPFIVWSAWIVLNAASKKRALGYRTAFLLGLLLGCALQIKQSSALEAGYVALVALHCMRYRPAHASVALAGVATPIVLGFVPYLATGNVTAYLDANVWTFFRRAAVLQAFPPFWPTLRQEIEAFFPSVFLAAALVFSRRQADVQAGLLVRVITGWAIVDLATLFAIREFSFQSLPLMAPLSLLGAWAIVQLARTDVERWSVAAIVLTLVAHSAGQFVDWGKVLAERLIRHDAVYGDGTGQLASYLRAHRGTGNWLYVANDETSLYFLADAPVPTKFIFPPYLIDPLNEAVAGVNGAAEIRRIFSEQPRYVVYRGRLSAPRGTPLAVVVSNLRRDYEPVYWVGDRAIYSRDPVSNERANGGRCVARFSNKTERLIAAKVADRTAPTNSFLLECAPGRQAAQLDAVRF